jgi:hypothetical protein
VIYVSVYLATGALLAALVYVLVGYSIDHRHDDAASEAAVSAVEKSVRAVPGGMATCLMLTMLLWPGLLFFLARGEDRG